MDGYWSKVTQSRVTRRRALGATGGMALSTAILAACGGSSDSGGDSSGQVVKLVDESKGAKKGGTFKFVHFADQQTLDPQFTSLPNQAPTNMVYSQLWYYPGGFLKPGDGELKGDLAASTETTPDGLTVTVKLTDKAAFGPVAPVNGRPVDAQDVMFSYQRFSAVGTRRTDLVNSLNPDAPILSMEAPDNKTIVMKLAAPLAIFPHIVSNSQAGSFFIVPKEAADEKVLDLRRTQAGSGPFYLDDYTPSVSYRFKRNPGFKQDERGFPYVDQIDMPIISEYAQQLAQLKSGAVYTLTGSTPLRFTDVLPTKADNPTLEMYQTPLTRTSTRMFFGMVPESPFRDERVRQAWSKSIDRDLLIDVVQNVPTFRDAGLPVDTAWDSALWCNSWAGYWLNPKGADWAKNYAYDIAEAKKLLAAAGHTNGLDFTTHYPATGYPDAYYLHIQTVLAMVKDAGFRPTIDAVNFNTDWRPKFANAKGNFSGMSFIVDSGGQEPATNLYLHYNSKGSLAHGYDPDGLSRFTGDPTLDNLTQKARLEPDVERRKALAIEIQKYEAKKVYFPLVGGGATLFDLSWPTLRNRWAWQDATNRNYAHFWIDPEKAPLKG